MVRRGRRADSNATNADLSAPNYITRNIPYYELASETQLARIHDQAEWIVEEVGIDFTDNANALDIWRKAGADVKGTRVRIPREMVREHCAKAPKQFIQKAKNPDFDVVIGGNHTVFATVFGPPFTRCLDKGRRYGNFEDFTKLVKIVSQLPHIHHGGLVICEPCDIPVNKRHLDMLYAHMRYSQKPFLGAITNRERAQDSVDMARIYFGEEAFNNNCMIMANVNTNSPLLVDQVVTNAIEVYCGAGQGIVVAPFILGGAMGPVTTAGAIAQAVAEVIACCTYTQIIKPGAPFVMGNFLSSMNLRSGAPTFGMPEPTLSNYIVGQLARRLGLPLRCGGSLTASKVADAQAAYESADSIHSTVMGGGNFILHSAGWLEGGLATGFEKLVLDADRLGCYSKLLRGIETDDNHLARSAYSEVEPGGHFLGSQHTLDNYKTAYYEATLSDSNSVEQWAEEGSKDALMRANERWKKILEDYEAPPIDEGVDENLREFIQKTKDSRDDAWY